MPTAALVAGVGIFGGDFTLHLESVVHNIAEGGAE
jgi:hypothetical protein